MQDETFLPGALILVSFLRFRAAGSSSNFKSYESCCATLPAHDEMLKVLEVVAEVY